MIKSNKFKKKIFKAISLWNNKTSQGKHLASKKIAEKMVECCKKIRKIQNISDDTRSQITLLAIFFKGLEELSALLLILSDKNWMEDTKNIEQVWNLLQNSEDRLNSTMRRISVKGEILGSIIKTIDDVEQLYLKYFGPGVYSSPEILIKKTECSICHSDFRKCDHLQGVIYNGELCKMMGVDIEFRGSSLVSEPRDRRCRIWPFNIEKEKNGAMLIKNSVMLTTFCIDDFLLE